MISDIFSATIFDPLYNLLIFLVSVLPGANVGLAVIVLTLIVKFILFPLSKKATEANMKMKEIQPEVKALQEKHKDNREQAAMEMLALYRDKKINPFSGLVVLFIQIPIILGLYWVFLRAGWPSINTDILYSFVTAPETVSIYFLGIDVTMRSVLLALIVGITQYYQVKIAMPDIAPAKQGATPNFKEDLARSMQLQMRYVLPVIIAVIAYTLSSAISLYWITNNLFMIWQELTIKRGRAHKQAEAA